MSVNQVINIAKAGTAKVCHSFEYASTLSNMTTFLFSIYNLFNNFHNRVFNPNDMVSN